MYIPEYCNIKKIISSNNYKRKDNSWISFSDFLGFGYLSYLEARKFVRSLKLKTSTEWIEYCSSGKRAQNIPSSHTYYKDDPNYEKGFGNWIGTMRVAFADKVWRPFKQAREFARSLQLKSVLDWRKFMKSKKKPSDIPVVPQEIYKEFISYADWLGTDNLNYKDIKWRSFKEARKYVRKLKLNGWREYWNLFDSGKIPKDIPRGPGKVYKEFTSIVDWLGSEKKPKDMEYRPFEDARKFVRALNFKSDREWGKYCTSGKKPIDIPRNFQKIYKDKGYINQSDFLGTETRDKSKFLKFEEARKVARKLKIKSYNEYISYGKNGKLPETIPNRPEGKYKNKGWISYKDFLGY